MRENIRTGQVPFRKAYLRSMIDRAEVDDHTIRIVGDTATLEQVIAGRPTPKGTPFQAQAMFADLYGNGAPGEILTSDPQIRILGRA